MTLGLPGSARLTRPEKRLAFAVNFSASASALVLLLLIQAASQCLTSMTKTPRGPMEQDPSRLIGAKVKMTKLDRQIRSRVQSRQVFRARSWIWSRRQPRWRSLVH